MSLQQPVSLSSRIRNSKYGPLALAILGGSLVGLGSNTIDLGAETTQFQATLINDPGAQENELRNDNDAFLEYFSDETETVKSGVTESETFIEEVTTPPLAADAHAGHNHALGEHIYDAQAAPPKAAQPRPSKVIRRDIYATSAPQSIAVDAELKAEVQQLKAAAEAEFQAARARATLAEQLENAIMLGDAVLAEQLFEQLKAGAMANMDRVQIQPVSMEAAPYDLQFEELLEVDPIPRG